MNARTPIGKKVFSSTVLLLALVFAIGLFRCSNQSESQKEEPKTNESTPVESSSELLEPEIKESGWSVTSSPYGGDNWVNYALIISNPDERNMYINSSVKITVKDAEGSILASETSYALFISPNDVMPIVGRTESLTGEPVEVSFVFNPGETSPTEGVWKITDFPISNLKENVSADGVENWTGELTNPTKNDFDKGVTPMVILRNEGSIVGGFSNNLMFENVASGATTSFEVDPLGAAVPIHDAFEVYVVPNIY